MTTMVLSKDVILRTSLLLFWGNKSTKNIGRAHLFLFLIFITCFAECPLSNKAVEISVHRVVW